MKKLFALAVLFTFAAAGVFAELTVSGLAGGGAGLVKGTNVNGDEIRTDYYLTGQVEASAQDENDTFGGSVIINGESSNSSDPVFNSWDWKALVWWKPIYQIRLQLGVIDEFALTDIVGWGYHANDAEEYVVTAKSNYVGDYFPQGTGFYTGTGSSWTGLTLATTPVYGLDLNLAVPFGMKDINGGIVLNPKASDIYLNSVFQAAYTVWGIGRIAVTLAGRGDGKLDYSDPYTPGYAYNPADPLTFFLMKSNSPSVYGSFFLTALEQMGIGVNAGFAYTLPAEDKDKKIIYHKPMEAGLGLSWGTDKYGIKARMAAIFGGYAESTGAEMLNEALMMGFGILPYYSIGICKIHLNAGISYKFADQYMDDNLDIYTVENSAALGWHLNPYITVKAGSSTFYAGIKVQCDGLKYVGLKTKTQEEPVNGIQEGLPIIEWGVPIGIQFEF